MSSEVRANSGLDALGDCERVARLCFSGLDGWVNFRGNRSLRLFLPRVSGGYRKWRHELGIVIEIREIQP